MRLSHNLCIYLTYALDVVTIIFYGTLMKKAALAFVVPFFAVFFDHAAYASYSTAVFTAANYYCGQRRSGNGDWFQAYEGGIAYGRQVWGEEAGSLITTAYRNDVYKEIGRLCPEYAKPFGSRAH